MKVVKHMLLLVRHTSQTTVISGFTLPSIDTLQTLGKAYQANSMRRIIAAKISRPIQFRFFEMLLGFAS